MADTDLPALQQQIVREIGRALGIASTGHISYHLKQLLASGRLVQTPHIARGITVPVGAAPLRPPGILVQGRIAAGDPLDILPTGDILAGIDPAQYPAGTFALEVRGDSMIEDHILDGDYVLITPTHTAAQRAIMVVTHLTEGERGAATLKRFVRTATAILLCPANAAYQPRRISLHTWGQEWAVQGTVCAIHRVPCTTAR